MVEIKQRSNTNKIYGKNALEWCVFYQRFILQSYLVSQILVDNTDEKL